MIKINNIKNKELNNWMLTYSKDGNVDMSYNFDYGYSMFNDYLIAFKENIPLKINGFSLLGPNMDRIVKDILK